MTTEHVSHAIFTVTRGSVRPGADVHAVAIGDGKIAINAIVVGAEGRGRRRGLLPVSGPVDAPPYVPRHPASHADPTGPVGSIIAATIGTTRTGSPKFISDASPVDASACIVVFAVEGGFRGSVSYTGDRDLSHGKPEAWCLQDPDDSISFLPFPGECLAEGNVAEGEAGRAGSHRQIIAMVPRHVVFRVGYHGRLYGGPAAHYLMFDGRDLRMNTWAERVAADLWFDPEDEDQQ